MGYNSKYKSREIEAFLDQVSSGQSNIFLWNWNMAASGQLGDGEFNKLKESSIVLIGAGTSDANYYVPMVRSADDDSIVLSVHTASTEGLGNLVFSFSADGSWTMETEELAFVTEEQLDGKQDKLISGTNIKTINGESILGSGDLTIEGGAKIYEWFYDSESESITLSQEEYDNIVEADLVVVNLGGLFSVTVSKTSKEVSEILGRYALIGQLELKSEGIKLYFNINIEISTKVATITIEEQEILTKTSQLENDTNFVALQGEELPYVETAGLYDPISSVLYSLPGGEWTGAEDKKLAGVVNVGGFNLVECQGITGSSGDIIVLPREADGYEDDILVTRSYLKTINGESILGSGNIEISGGSGGGSAAYPYVDNTSVFGTTYFTISPNTFYEFGEHTVLEISLGAEKSDVANEYLFQFVSGSEATSLTINADIKWANDEPLTIEPNKIYQVSILKGLASVLEFSNAPNVALITFYYSGFPYSAEEGMTWEQWCNSAYNNTTLKISGGILTVNGIYPVYNSSGMSVYGTDVIIENEYYDMGQSGLG